MGKTGYAFVISQNGTMIIHPDSSFVMRESIFSIAEENRDARLRVLGQRMITGESGIEIVHDYWSDDKVWLAFTPIASNGWSFAVMLPAKEVMADVLALNRRLILLMIIGFLGLFFAVSAISYSLTRPLKKLAAGAKKLASGKLDTKITGIRQSDEVGQLAVAFNHMSRDLKKYIHDLTESTKAQERVEKELSIAHDIQQSILPHTYPPFPDRKEFDLYAISYPAREVGGDFYDFFCIDKNHLGLVIGDVSGKGVPAALFMAITRTLIKTAATDEYCPKKTLQKVNEIICSENPSSLFVTVFYAVYDIENGSIEFTNAGHNLPYIKRLNGCVESVHRTKSLALGILPDFELEKSTLSLHIGDCLLFYTDGLTEAENADHEMYEEARVEKFMNTLQEGNNIKNSIHSLLASVQAFAAGVEQFDDITLLALKRMH